MPAPVSEPKAYMPLFIGDYLADTSDLSAEEHGAYLLLLMTMWRRGGSLPSNAGRLSRIASVSSERWPAVWAVIGVRRSQEFDTSARGLCEGALS